MRNDPRLMLDVEKSEATDRKREPSGLSAFGRSFGSFGEIVQGRLSNGEDFLVTLPVNMYSVSRITCRTVDGPSVVDCSLPKSREVAERLLKILGLDDGVRIRVSIARTLPVGKGLSSSTADMLAVVRAFEEAFGFNASPTFISRLFSSIEPHDGVQYDNCVVYNHRKGTLLDDLRYIPRFNIVAVDWGGVVDTLSYNSTLSFDDAFLASYDKLLSRLKVAFAEQDDAAIGACANRSTELQGERTNNAVLFDALRVASNIKALGALNTHSGTVVGFLLPGNTEAEKIAEVAETVRKRFHKSVFITRTLDYLV